MVKRVSDAPRPDIRAGTQKNVTTEKSDTFARLPARPSGPLANLSGHRPATFKPGRPYSVAAVRTKTPLGGAGESFGARSSGRSVTAPVSATASSVRGSIEPAGKQPQGFSVKPKLKIAAFLARNAPRQGNAPASPARTFATDSMPRSTKTSPSASEPPAGRQQRGFSVKPTLKVAALVGRNARQREPAPAAPVPAPRTAFGAAPPARQPQSEPSGNAPVAAEASVQAATNTPPSSSDMNAVLREMHKIASEGMQQTLATARDQQQLNLASSAANIEKAVGTNVKSASQSG